VAKNEKVSFESAKNNLANIMDKLDKDLDYLQISRENADDVVLMSLKTYNGLIETLYLMKSPKNLMHLQKSIAQYESGEIL